jgi:hypothetical protein
VGQKEYFRVINDAPDLVPGIVQAALDVLPAGDFLSIPPFFLGATLAHLRFTIRETDSRDLLVVMMRRILRVVLHLAEY